MATVVNDAYFFGNKPATDLKRLTKNERQVLRLLAEGHTAKTIATELAVTPTAVNERLREARRKTGVGSSRELARLLRAEEGEEIAPFFETEMVEPTDWWLDKRLWALLAFLLALLAAALALTLRPNPPKAGPTRERLIFDPYLGTFKPQGPAWLYAVVRQEQRDTNWAPRTEALLRSRYSKIGLLSAPGTTLRTRCGNSVCEVAASIIGSDPKNVAVGDDSEMNRTSRELVGRPIHDEMKKVGLISAGELLTSAPDRPDHALFLAYYMREKS